MSDSVDPIEHARRRMRLLHAPGHLEVKARNRIDTGDKSLVQQQFRDEVDVNTIVRRFGLSQAPPPKAGGVYGDFTGISDYASAQAALERAREGFMSLPAEVRAEFDNDPGAFLEFSQIATEEEMNEVIGGSGQGVDDPAIAPSAAAPAGAGAVQVPSPPPEAS